MFLGNYLISVEPVETWCKKYDLIIKIYPCKICGEMLKTNIPFFTKEFRGLMSEDCSCGNKNVPFSLVSSESN